MLSINTTDGLQKITIVEFHSNGSNWFNWKNFIV